MKKYIKIIIFIVVLIISILEGIIIYNYSSLDKYIPLEKALQKISQHKYTYDYKCLNFSEDLVKELQSIGIQAQVVTGESPETLKDDNTGHAWVGIWIEPQTGEFTKDYITN